MPPIEIIYYTDPLCSWSWAFEPQWRRLRYEFGEQLSWRYRMGGMIADWRSYSDPLNAIDRPAQMGPQWFQVRQTTGMPLDDRIWLEDPPASSYPACIAVKAAGRQGAAIEEQYLRRLREAVMTERRNIARREVLLDLAQDLAAEPVGPDRLEVEPFERDLEGAEAIEAFREDLKETRYRGIGRFPTLVLQRSGGGGILIVGYRPYDALRTAVARVAPASEPVRRATSAVEYRAYWGRITDREVTEALSSGSPPAGYEQEAAAARPPDP